MTTNTMTTNTMTTNAMTTNAIRFQGGGQYTIHGQRIAAQYVTDRSGTEGVYMVDVDRGLDYFFPGIELHPFPVMSAYLHNRGTWFDHDDKIEIRTELENFAAGEEQEPVHLGDSPYRETMGEGRIHLHDGAFTLWTLCAEYAQRSWEEIREVRVYNGVNPRQELANAVLVFMPEPLWPSN